MCLLFVYEFYKLVKKLRKDLAAGPRMAASPCTGGNLDRLTFINMLQTVLRVL